MESIEEYIESTKEEWEKAGKDLAGLHEINDGFQKSLNILENSINKKEYTAVNNDINIQDIEKIKKTSKEYQAKIQQLMYRYTQQEEQEDKKKEELIKQGYLKDEDNVAHNNAVAVGRFASTVVPAVNKVQESVESIQKMKGNHGALHVVDVSIDAAKKISKISAFFQKNKKQDQSPEKEMSKEEKEFLQQIKLRYKLKEEVENLKKEYKDYLKNIKITQTAKETDKKKGAFGAMLVSIAQFFDHLIKYKTDKQYRKKYNEEKKINDEIQNINLKVEKALIQQKKTWRNTVGRFGAEASTKKQL